MYPYFGVLSRHLWEAGLPFGISPAIAADFEKSLIRKSLWKKSLAFRRVEKPQNGNVGAIEIEISKAIHLTG